MKKKILLSGLLFAGLFLSVNSAMAAPPPPPHGGHHPPHHGGMHRPPMHHGHLHQPPRIHHHHHVRHYGGFISPYYYGGYYPLDFGYSRIYYPMRYYHPSHFGATFHISI